MHALSHLAPGTKTGIIATEVRFLGDGNGFLSNEEVLVIPLYLLLVGMLLGCPRPVSHTLAIPLYLCSFGEKSVN